MEFITNILDSEDKSCALKNCIRNHFKHLRKWAVRTQTNCFRIYDRDIKEFPLAIDFYDHRFCIHYFSFDRDLDEPKLEHKVATEKALKDLFGAKEDQIFWRTRIKREKFEQYEKNASERIFFHVLEYGVKFWINLTDYLDTGLFLDHREIRKYVSGISKDKRVLNLFAYTCSFSVHAANGGASFTKSVDMSNTYTTWGERNFLLNGFSLRNHEIVRADCLKFLESETGQYDIIIIDPPTLSRSKKMDGLFDIQQDHVFLITKALALLSPGGVIFFSTNSRKFVLERDRLPSCQVFDVTKKTLPLDFRDPKIHLCWKITR